MSSSNNSGPDVVSGFGQLDVQVKPSQPPRRIVITQPIFRIGRLIDNDLVLPHELVSRHHTQITCGLEGCEVEDLGSRNKTFLNEEELPPNVRRPLIDGDVIRIGEVIITFRMPEVKDSEVELAFTETMPLAVEAVLPPLPEVWPLPPRSTYLRYLPAFFSRDGLMDRYLRIFEAILAPIEQLVDHMPMQLDPRTMSPDFLPWVASWLDLTLNENWEEDRHRDLISSAAELYRWRGTLKGLSRYLEIYAGVTPEIDDQLGEPHTFSVRLTIPKDPPPDFERLVHTIIQAEKPAHTTYELELISAKA